MNIKKLSDEGVEQTLNEILNGLKTYMKNNPECNRELLTLLSDCFSEVDGEDFFGTSGWEDYFNIA